MKKAERRLLRLLRDAGDEGVLHSSIAKSCYSLLADLEECSAVRRKLMNRATRVRIVNQTAFSRFIESRFPLGIDTESLDALDRAAAVVAFGDAKAIRRGSEEGIILRSAYREMRLTSSDGLATIPVGQLSADAGGAALQLTSGRRWTFSGRVVVVENVEPFWRYEQVLPHMELAVFACGNMSNRLVDWLVSDDLKSCSLVHWGDYDPRGVLEYLRLAERCPDRTSPFVPDHIESLMKYGNRRLLLRQRHLLDKLRTKTTDPHVARMVALFDKHCKALEQEGLLEAPTS